MGDYRRKWIIELQERANLAEERGKRITELEAERRRFYHADGSFTEHEPDEVVRLRKEAAAKLAKLEVENADLRSQRDHEWSKRKAHLAAATTAEAELAWLTDLGDELRRIRKLVGLPDGTNDDWSTADLVEKRMTELARLTEANRWIQVEERLPELPEFDEHKKCPGSDWVEIWIKGVGRREARIKHLRYGTMWFDRAGNRITHLEVTHWRPLPEGPES